MFEIGFSGCGFVCSRACFKTVFILTAPGALEAPELSFASLACCDCERGFLSPVTLRNVRSCQDCCDGEMICTPVEEL